MISGAVICLDSTEEVIDEAINNGCNLVIAHHPIVFSGIKKLNGKNYVERTLIKAIKNDVAIYAIHTNLDNVKEGVNKMISNKLGLTNCRVLAPVSGRLKKLVTFCPVDVRESVLSALFAAGAGSIGNYDECSFNIPGKGTFRGNEFSNPVVGQKGVRHEESEIRIEVILEDYNSGRIIAALKQSHPYEEVAYDLYPLENEYQNIGSGMIGKLEKPLSRDAFLEHLKTSMQTGCIRYTETGKTSFSKIAVCGGSGSFLLRNALAEGADAFVTADFKYHQFFDAEGKIMIADIGHYESEHFTKELIFKYLNEKFTTFALRLSEVNTNPVRYY